MTRRPNGPAPPDAMRTAMCVERAGDAIVVSDEPLPGVARSSRPVEIVIKKTSLPTPHLAIVTSKVSDPRRLRPFEIIALDGTTGEISNIGCFASVAAALMHHGSMVRAVEQAKNSTAAANRKIGTGRRA